MRSRSDKEGQIFKLINVGKKVVSILCAVNLLKMWCYKCDVYVDQLLLWNLMVSFLFTYDPQKSQENALEKVTSKIDMILKTKTAHFGGYKLSYRLEILHTG